MNSNPKGTNKADLIRGSLIGLSLLIFYCLPVISQSKALLFDRLTMADGLPNPSVLDIIQDDQGFIWMATPAGIVRYDGYEMVTYRPQIGDPDDQPALDYPTLYQDHSGTIWVGMLSNSKSGLFYYDPGLDNFVPFLYKPGQVDYPIRDGVLEIGEDGKGRLLVGTGGIGLYIIDKTDLTAGRVLHHFQPVPEHPDSLPDGDVLDLFVEETKGHIWMATYGGLCKYIPEEGRFQTFRFSSDSTGLANICYSILPDSSKFLWVGTKKAGLWKFDLDKEEFIKQYLPNSDDPSGKALSVGRIAWDRKGRLWVNSALSEQKNKLNLFDPDSEHFIRILDRDQSGTQTPFSVINDLLMDRSGNMWIASWQKGVFRYNLDKDAFHILDLSEIISGNEENVILENFKEEKEGIYWASTNKGFFRWDRPNNSWRRFTYEAAGEFLLDDNGKIWYENNKQLSCFDPLTNQTRDFPQLKDNFAIEIIKKSDGSIWCCLSDKEKICQLVDDSLICVEPGKNIGFDFVTTIAEGPSGNLWLGENHWGLVRFDPATGDFERYISRYGVHYIQFDRKGRCWVVTHSNGLKLFDREEKKIIQLDKEQDEIIGLAESIEMDNRGILWVSGSGGLVQFDPDTRQVLRRFRMDQLYLNMEITDNTLVCKGYNGELFLNLGKRLVYFHPDSLRLDTLAPQVVFTEFRVFTEKLEPGPESPLKEHISQTENITLAYHQNDFTARFAALHYKAPSENKYRYLLENYDQEWQKTGKQREARYTNLRPGQYTLRVQAANSDGIWTGEEEEAILWITITPPWYANIYAYFVYGLLFLAILYGIYRFLLGRRLAEAEAQRLLEMDRFKSRFYTNITHEFRTPLTLILGAAEQLPEKADSVIHQSKRLIRKQGKHLLKLINQLLDLSKLESDKLELREIQADVIPFIKGVVASFESAAIRKNLQFSYHCEVESLIMDFDPEKLQMILSNLLSNAIKFTPSGGKVQFAICKEQKANYGNLPTPIAIGDCLLLTIKDTGIGIPTEELPHIFDRFYQVDPSSTREGEGTGIGLALAKELVELMEGKIDLRSEVGAGSTFEVVLPVKRSKETPGKDELIKPFDQEEEPLEAVSDGPLFPGPESIEKPLVLVVEDNRDMSRFMCEILEGNYRTQTAFNGELGVKKAIQIVPDIIISDVMMPRMDGFELCRTLKSDERTSHIPIILLTAKAGQENRLEGLEFGADAFLEKPFDQKELDIRLEQLIRLRKRLQEKMGLGSFDSEEFQSGNSQEVAFLKKVRALLLENISDSDLDVNQMCKLVGMSRTQLHNKIKALTGKPTARFIRSLRLQQARKLILTTSYPISQIAYMVGFKDANHFSTIFKEEFEKPPSSFRQA